MSLKRLRLNSVETMLKSALDYAPSSSGAAGSATDLAVIAVLVKLGIRRGRSSSPRCFGVGGKPFGAFRVSYDVRPTATRFWTHFPDLKAELERRKC